MRVSVYWIFFFALNALASPLSEHVAQRHPGADWCTKLQAMPNAGNQLQQLYQTEVAKGDDLRSTRFVQQLLAAMKCVGGKENILRSAAENNDPKATKTRKFAEKLVRGDEAASRPPQKIRVKRRY